MSLVRGHHGLSRLNRLLLPGKALRRGLRCRFAPKTRADYTPFLIATIGRSGSTYLVERLASHKSIVSFGEVLNPAEVQWGPGDFESGKEAMKRRDSDIRAFLLNEVWGRAWPGTEAMGFKLILQSMLKDHAALKQAIEEVEGVRVIHLTRDNILATAVSHAAMRAGGPVQRRARTAQVIEEALTIDAALCKSVLSMNKALRTAVDDLFQSARVLRLSYEEMFAAPEETDRRLCAFLQVQVRPMRSPILKLSRGRLRDRIANYDALKEHFQGSEFERYFEDP